jgi:hypothetical protein
LEGYLIDQRTAGGYQINLWGIDPTANYAYGYGRFSIERDGVVLLEIPEADTFIDSPAVDLTGEGEPDILLGLRNGGSHCCTGTVLINLGAEPEEIIRIWSSILGDSGKGTFVDLNGDNVYELITADSIKAPCTTPTVKVILQYQAGLGYQQASSTFPEQYNEDIAAAIDRLEEETAIDGTVHRCFFPTVVGSYFYSGRPEEARAVFDQYYTGNDNTAFWLNLTEGISDGRFYGG